MIEDGEIGGTADGDLLAIGVEELDVPERFEIEGRAKAYADRRRDGDIARAAARVAGGEEGVLV